MSRKSLLVVSMALVLALVAPLTASAASPSATDMLKEQIGAQKSITALMGTAGKSSTWINTITFGKATKTSTKATIPVTCRTAGGTTVKGVLVVKKYGTKWYFYSISQGSTPNGIDKVTIPGGITTKSLGAALSNQGNHQYLMTGIISGGYKKITVTSRHTYSNAKQINIRLSGGSRRATTGRVLAYRKTASNGSKLWFISAIK